MHYLALIIDCIFVRLRLHSSNCRFCTFVLSRYKYSKIIEELDELGRSKISSEGIILRKK